MSKTLSEDSEIFESGKKWLLFASGGQLYAYIKAERYREMKLELMVLLMFFPCIYTVYFCFCRVFFWLIQKRPISLLQEREPLPFGRDVWTKYKLKNQKGLTSKFVTGWFCFAAISVCLKERRRSPPGAMGG